MEEKFVVVLVIGLAIFGLIFVFQSVDGGFLGEDQQEVDNVFVDKSYGVLGRSNSDTRSIRFGDFTVGELRGSVLAYRNEKSEVSDSLFGGEKIVFRYNATQPREGNLTFEVLGRTGRGDVYVDVNGQRVFQEALIATGSPEITIDQSKLKPGINRFEIGVKRNSIFGSTSYTLEEIEARINDRKFHDFEETFQLYSYELQDYVESPLTFSIRRSIKTAPLRIFVNDKRVYSREQVRSQERIQVTPNNADLTPGANTIRFETEKPAEYVIDNAQLTMRYIGNVERQDVVFDFQLSERQLNYAKKDSTNEEIVFDYQNMLPSPRPVRISVNGLNRTFIPQNGENRIEMPETALERQNSFEFRSNGTYQLNRLRILSTGEK